MTNLQIQPNQLIKHYCLFLQIKQNNINSSNSCFTPFATNADTWHTPHSHKYKKNHLETHKRQQINQQQ